MTFMSHKMCSCIEFRKKIFNKIYQKIIDKKVKIGSRTLRNNHMNYIYVKQALSLMN